jgi:hypothetical protein
MERVAPPIGATDGRPAKAPLNREASAYISPRTGTSACAPEPSKPTVFSYWRPYVGELSVAPGKRLVTK